MRMSGSDIQRATRGKWRDGAPEIMQEVVTDTRDFKAGQTFLALRGPHFDGHAFAHCIADQAQALIGDHEGIHLWDNLNVHQLEVDDTLKAFGDIAHAWRMQLHRTRLIAISGSYGKTSMRSLLEHGFRQLGLRVAATRANLNNLVGVPQTLLSIAADADIAIIECGISEIGEMQRLAGMVHPDVAILTGLSAAHGEGLGGIEGIAREKALLLNELSEHGWCALGSGVGRILQQYRIALPDDAIDAEQSNAVAWELKGTELTLSHAGESALIKLALPARHWAANMAFAATVMLRLLKQLRRSSTLHTIAEALSDWQPAAGRMQHLAGQHGSLILDDSYNANPASMQAALDTLAAMDGRRVAILGDMAELGDSSASAHRSLNLEGIEKIFLIGQHMRTLSGKYAQARCFSDTDEAIAYFRTFRAQGNDIILIKASRSMALDRIVSLLTTTQEGMHHAV
jgi:UDP-N-acetylmuramoyl-tripeptide--D-alanyl-D-alanine ligase